MSKIVNKIIIDGKVVDFATLPPKQKQKISAELGERFARSAGFEVVKKAK